MEFVFPDDPENRAIRTSAAVNYNVLAVGLHGAERLSGNGFFFLLFSFLLFLFFFRDFLLADGGNGGPFPGSRRPPRPLQDGGPRTARTLRFHSIMCVHDRHRQRAHTTLASVKGSSNMSLKSNNNAMCIRIHVEHILPCVCVCV